MLRNVEGVEGVEEVEASSTPTFSSTSSTPSTTSTSLNLPQPHMLSITHLSKSFGSFQAVSDLSFSVNAGEVYGFLGQNGAGKSTTIRMILSLIRPTGGNIEIFGKSLFTDREYILRKIGAVVEKPDLYRYLSGYENLSLFAKLSDGNISKAAIMDCLSLVGLEKRAKDPVRVYSQGMKQRLGIAVALVHDPELIILDEPTNGLDPQGIADIRNLIIMLSKERGKTVLVSSHLLSEIEQIADSMLIINKGKKIVEGKVKELVNPEKLQLEIVCSDNNRAFELLASTAWGKGLKKSTSQSVSVETAADAVASLNKYLVENDVGVTSMRSMNSLEAYFLSLTSGNEVS
jgi:ABC-type multidrug transport system ATPase subunit